MALASAQEGVGIEYMLEPLAIRLDREGHPSASRNLDWRLWENRDLVTPRAYAGFTVMVVGRVAARKGAWEAFWPLLREAACFGELRPTDLLLYVGLRAVPQEARRWIRALLGAR